MVDEVVPSESNTLTWNEVEGAAELAFNIWVGQPELKWAKQAWEILIDAGLATYSTETERCEVVIRFLALAGFYLEFCSVAWEEYDEPNYLEWAEELGLSAFDLRQLINSEPDWNSDRNEDSDEDEDEDEYELDSSELEYLANHTREEVLAALLRGFGSNESMLFVSLWRSNRPEIDQEDEEDEEDEEDDCYETDDEILNYNLTAQKLAAFEWLTQKCPARSVEETKLQQRSTSTQGAEETRSENVKDDAVEPDRPFSVETFDLLEQLHKKPTLDFYLAHEEEFKKYVEKPFQGLFRQVAAQLPDAITKHIDMECEIFAYPRWNLYYRSAFYRKQSNSTLDAQFFISLSKKNLYFGLIIYNRSRDRERFIHNYRTNSQAKEVSLQQKLPNGCTLHGLNRYFSKLEDWLKSLARKNSPTKNIQASVHLNKDKVLQCSAEQLRDQIAQTFEGLFTLFLLAICDDPMPAIKEYLNFRHQLSFPFSYQPSIPSEKTKLKPEYSLSQEDSKPSVFVRRYVEPSFTQICQYVRSKGLRISDSTLRRYHLALTTRKFVILSGISGMGKTWLTQTYADAVKAEYLLVPVAPNWTTNEDLLGYFNPMGKQYHDTAFSRFLEKAEEEYKQAQADERPPLPYHLVLDEMNLARVEYYFAKFLSAMEVRMREGVAQIELAPDKQVLLPPNLYFIGTVNVDETTHSFADKVYDRAQLIELEAPREDLYEHLGEVPYREILMQIWDNVHVVAPFAFRVLDEIKTYVKEAEALGVSWQEALDEQLLQKILPKLKGADDRVGVALKAFVDLAGEKGFHLSHAKATEMLETFNKHGFTSYF